jgi:outer membrane receptor protein involved in Fe transport
MSLIKAFDIKKQLMHGILFSFISHCVQAIEIDYFNREYTLDDELAYIKAEFSLNDHVVSSSKFEQKITDAPSIISVFSDVDIERLGANTLGDVLQIVPGMQVEMKNNGRQKIWIRGVQSEFNQKILIYLDGVPFRDVFGDFATDEELPLDNVRRIEIIRGPGGSLYGANAYSGVINLYTYKPGEKKQQRLNIRYGNQNTQSAYFAIDQTMKIGNILFDGKILHSDSTKPQFDNQGLANSRSREKGLSFARLKAGFFDNQLLLTGYFGEYKYQRADLGINNDNFRRHRNIYLDAAYQHSFNDKLSIENKATYIWRKRYENEDIFTGNTKQTLLSSMSYIDPVESFSSRNYLTYKANDTNTLISGFEIDHNYLNSRSFDNVNSSVTSFIVDPKYQGLSFTNYSILAQDTQSFFDKQLIFTAGLRYDILQLFNNQFSYRLGLVYNFSPEIFSKLLYATAYRSPTNQEFTRASLNAAIPDSETIKTIEAQIGYQNSLAHYTLTAYYNKLNGVIDRNNQFFQPNLSTSNLSDQFTNLTRQEMYGIEFESKFFLNQQFDGFINGTWFQAKNLTAHRAIPLLTDWTLSFGLNWRYKWAIGEFHIDNNVMVYGNRRDWPSDIWNSGQQQRYPNREDSFNKGFAIWNLGIHYDIKSTIAKGLKLALLVRNVTDEIYYSQDFTVPLMNQPATFDNQYDRRQVIFNVDYSF